MYVTHQELRAQNKEMRGEIAQAAKDLGGDIRYLHDRINELQLMLETQAETIRQITDHENFRKAQ